MSPIIIKLFDGKCADTSKYHITYNIVLAVNNTSINSFPMYTMRALSKKTYLYNTSK